jgi:hypothetical protein
MCYLPEVVFWGTKVNDSLTLVHEKGIVSFIDQRRRVRLADNKTTERPKVCALIVEFAVCQFDKLPKH